MNIGIIGAGNIGTGIGKRLAAKGHTVLLSFSRSPDKLEQAAEGARIVKAVPPFAEVLHSPSTTIDGRRPAVFVCGDNETARQVVLGLVDDIEARGIDAGPLDLARYTEPLGMLLVQLAYARGFGARIGADLLREMAHG